jgi:hypothetical protein
MKIQGGDRIRFLDSETHLNLKKMIEAEHTYGVNCTLMLCCQHFIFHVHRDILSQASPVFMSILHCPYIDPERIYLSEEDPNTLMLAFDIIYSSILGDIMFKVPYEDINLDAVVNKYNLAGVRNIIKCFREKESIIRASEDRESALENRVKILEMELQKEKTKAGSVADYRHTSLNGKRVVENVSDLDNLYNVIANEGDGSTEIGVLCDDGTKFKV